MLDEFSLLLKTVSAAKSKKKRKADVDICSNQRFMSPKKGLETYQQSFCPENTKINTRWAVKNFVDWAASYNERHSDAKCPEGVLLSDSAPCVSADSAATAMLLFWWCSSPELHHQCVPNTSNTGI